MKGSSVCHIGSRVCEIGSPVFLAKSEKSP